MAKGPLLLGAWAATLAAAFVFGRWIGSATPAPADGAETSPDTAALEQRIADLTRKLADERAHRAASEGARRAAPPRADDDEPAAASGRAAPPTPGAPEGSVDAPGDTFTLEGAKDTADASRRFMAFVDAQLGRGEKGFDAILAAMSKLHDEREALQGLFQDEPTALREMVPWLRFLFRREPEMLDLNEYVFRTMADEPAKFASISSDNVLEMFTEGFGVVIPGAMDEARMTRFRGYAQKMLETSPDAQPEAVRGNRSEVERLLTRFWAAPPTPEEALSKLRAGTLSPELVQNYLRRLRPEDLASLDVTALLVSMIERGGHYPVWVMDQLPADRLDRDRVDAALLDAMATGKGNAWVVASFFRHVGRTTWADVRPFVERALASNEAARRTVAELLSTQLDDSARPRRDWVAEVLARGVIPGSMEARLRAAYGLTTK